MIALYGVFRPDNKPNTQEKGVKYCSCHCGLPVKQYKSTDKFATPACKVRYEENKKRVRSVNDLAAKALERKSLIAECDRIFSLYIRAKFFNHGLCYICGAKGNEGNPIQNGHLISRGNLSIRWVEDCCRPCCRNCNEYLSGNLVEFEKKLIQEIGKSRIVFLHDIKRSTFKINNNELKELIEKFSKMLSELK